MKESLAWIGLSLTVALTVAIVWLSREPAREISPGTIEVFPQDVRLNSKRSRQDLVVRLTNPNGVTRDVTANASFSADPRLARMEGRTVTPLTDGTGSVQVTFGGHTASVPLEIKNAAVASAVSFQRDVMPVFLKAGCNTGACHGSARGKDGFHLSLFGYDPDGDYFRLTREVSGRRLNPALPGESLLLQKATGAVAHTGGKRFEKNSELYQTLVRWIADGAPSDTSNVATPTALEISPKQLLLEGPNTTQQMTVRATYSDGSVRDVTSLAVFLTNNDASAKVSASGLITSGQRGEAFVMARFATFTVGSEAIVIPKDLAFEFPQVAEVNYVDHAVDDKLRRLRIAPSELASDEEFLRRIYIDTIGLLPTSEEHDRFLADADPAKRAKLIDSLVARPEFVDLWVMKLAEMLEIHSAPGQGLSYKSTLLYFDWLRERLATNTPINEIVRDLVGSKGGNFTNPAANYYEEEIDPLKLAENCAQSFLGFRMQCAQCHNHPFDRWTMNDYRGFVGFFSQVGRKKAEDPRETIVFNTGEGESKHPVTNKPVPPRFPGGEVPDVKGKDRREVLAGWLSSPENPWMPKHFANVIWAQFFGRGIIEPVDDVRVSNPPANAELLDQLGRRLVESRYDFRQLIRDICNSRTYQLSSIANASNEADTRNFSHAPIRRLRAEVMLDSVSEVTDTRDKFRGLPLGARAVQIADGNESSYFLKTFGRATRETVCSCEVAVEPNLSQALHLLNGDTVQHKINEGGLVKKLLDAKKAVAPVVDELYVRCFGRKPSGEEKKALEPLLAANPAKLEESRKPLEDLFWALLNAKEFMFNH